MDDSDLDFADLCSKLLKRVRKKERADSGDDHRKESSQNLTQNADPAPTQSRNSTKRRKPKQDAELSPLKKLDCLSVSASQLNRPAREESTAQPCASNAPAASTAVPCAPSSRPAVACGTAGLGLAANKNGDVNLRAKDKVVSRMQQFRWVSPQKMTHVENDQPWRTTLDAEDRTPLSAVPQAVDSLQGPLGDEVVALRLQEELDREARGTEERVDLEQGGLFFCQICQKDLSAMSPLRRTQHINRCLDESEGSGPAAPAPAPPAVPECPICGKMFKSQKSRASHLKRCSAEMGVAPALLLQALQRQAAETASDDSANQLPQASGSKRKGSSDPHPPPGKRKRKKAGPLDEDTMVALALSRSMLEQEREREMEREREREREALLAAPAAAADHLGPGLRWRAEAGNAGKRRGKKKGQPPAPPPLLLVQDPGEALRRLQDRVAALLLHARPPTPPTPPRPASSLPGWTGAAPLWQKSALQDGGRGSVAEFYAPALCPPVQPWTAGAEMQTVAPPAQVETLAPATTTGPAPCTPRLGSQTLGDLMDLAEEGLTLTQWGYTPKADPAPDSAPEPTEELQLSGFVPERRRSAGAAENTVALSRLAADLSSMVNNPQLSDVQLQVDGGQVFFAHSFMLYARCPLLVRMVHDSGFGVEEEGMPRAQRVLLGDVPPEAVRTLLQYLYCARCPLTPFLLPHVLELALRFDLEELAQECRAYTGGAEAELWVESREQKDEDEEEDRGEEKFLELLRSMWEEEEEAEEGGGGDGEGQEVEGGAEGKVDEDELLEIYEFAATQRKTAREEEEEQRGTGIETEEEEEHREKGEDCISTFQTASQRLSNCPSPHSAPSGAGAPNWLNSSHITLAAPTTDSHSGTEVQTSQPRPGQKCSTSLDRSYDRLFSETWGDYSEPSRSQGALIDLSISPLPEPCGSALPSAGVSPESAAPPAPEERAQKQESVGCSQISATRLEPELIELSDSGEEADAVRRTPSPSSAAGFRRGRDSTEDSCAEVSWLVPGTPEPPARATRVGSTQTHCSMRRTRLFAASASSSSSSLSSPSLCTDPPILARPAESGDGAVPGPHPPSCLSPAAPSPAPQSDPARDLSSPAPTFTVPPGQSGPPSLAWTGHPILDGKLSRVLPGPASSTPLLPHASRSATVPEQEERRPESVCCGPGGSPPLCLRLSGSASPSPRKHTSDRGEEGMEDPPMAFDESWGLDGARGPDLRFSLRLDSSTGASRSEPGSGETTPPAPPPPLQPGDHAQSYTSLLDSKIWEDWEEEEDGASLPLSQRVQHMGVTQRVRQLKTPEASRRKGSAPLVPITPMPGYSDMDTPELKNRLNRFGVRPLPKRQMVLKLKEIHQYTHQLMSSESEEDGPAPGPAPKSHPSSVSMTFKQPERPAAVGAWSKDSSHKQAGPEEEGEGLSASQGSTASSTAASEDSERSNPELCCASDSDSEEEEEVTASQAGARGAEKLRAVRSFILSDPELYGRVLRYEPLVLSQLQAQLRAHGLRLASAKLLDFLDSQCITFTTARPAKPGPPPRRRGRGRGRRRGGAASD